MRILICGSRHWQDIHAIRMCMVKLDPNTEIIHGAAPGADSIAGFLADDFGFSVRSFPADWKKYGRAAGPIRNKQMLDEEPDLVIAFRMPNSRGTQNTINEARRRKIPVKVVDGEVK